MIKPAVYTYILFIILFYYLLKEGYWKGVFAGSNDWLKKHYKESMVYIILVISTVIFLDLPVYRLANSYRTPFLEELGKIAYQVGKGEVLLSLLLIVALGMLILKKEKLYHLFSITLMSTAFSGIMVNLIKAFFSRQRPFVEQNPFKFLAFIEAYQQGELFRYPFLSMPSGHTITIFAAVIPLILYFKNKLIRILLITIAVIMSLSRIYTNEHWLSDVLIAAYLALIFSRVIYNNNQAKLN